MVLFPSQFWIERKRETDRVIFFKYSRIHLHFLRQNEFKCARKQRSHAILLLIWYHISLHNIRGSVKLPFCISRGRNSIKFGHKPQYFILTFDGESESRSHLLATDFYFIFSSSWDAQFSTTRSTHKFNSRKLCMQQKRGWALDSITGSNRGEYERKTQK